MRRKIPRGHTPKKVGQLEDEYNEDGDGMDTDEESQDLEVVTRAEMGGNPKMKKRNSRPEEMPLEAQKKMDMVLDPYDLATPIKKPQEQVKDKVDEGNTSGTIETKDRRKALKNFNARTSKMGIVREVMNPQILE